MKNALSWRLALPLIGLLVAIALVGLAVTAERALEESGELSLDGRLLRLALDLEVSLRDDGPAQAPANLAAALQEHSTLVAGMQLLDGELVEVAKGSQDGRRWEIELLLGREWAGAGWGPPPFGEGQRGLRGRRTLVAFFYPPERSMFDALLVPISMLAGLLLIILAEVGARGQAHRLELQQLEASRSRSEALGRAGAGLAHQLRNPLATIKGSIQLLQERCLQTEQTRLMKMIEQARRMEHLLDHLLDYTRPPRPEPSDVDCEELLELVIADIDDVALIDEPSSVVTARVDAQHLEQIVGNLVSNAVAAGLPVEVAATNTANKVIITISDRGPGPGDDPEKLFEPYVSERPDGTGLGLPIARALCEANGGTLVLLARAEGGTVAKLELPAGAQA